MQQSDIRGPETAADPALAETPVPAPARDSRTAARAATVVALVVIAYGTAYIEVVSAILAGSRIVFPVVAPVLIALIASGYRTAPRGVGDAESDWIAAALLGVGGFSTIALLSERVPTLAGLWQLPLLGAVIWLAVCITVLFGIRRVAQMWQMWLFALAAAPLPQLLSAGALGGSDAAIISTAMVFAAIAVLLATRPAPPAVRLTAAAATLASGITLEFTVGTGLGLLATILLTCAVVPVLATIWAGRRRREPQSRPVPPDRSRASFVVLAAAAVALMLTAAVPFGAGAAEPVRSVDDWAARAGLGVPTEFPFAAAYLGPGATLVRYPVPAVNGAPSAAVDVLSCTSRAALDDLAYAVWYPSDRPVDIGSGGVAHSNRDAARGEGSSDWYARTWLWHNDTGYQRVTVVVSQDGDGRQPPPPHPLTLADTAIRPLAWLARQQPDEPGKVDPAVVERANQIVQLLKAAASPPQ